MSDTKVIAIASGKGGVGKTTVSANLSVALAQAGKQVMLFDADLGLANAQLALGIKAQYNISHVLSGEKSFNEIVVRGPSGLLFVPGASGIGWMASLSAREVNGIIQGFSEFKPPLEFLIVDVPAGISDAVTTFIRACGYAGIVVKDEPSSISDAYSTIKILMKDCNYKNIHLIPNMVPSQQSGGTLYKRINAVCERFLNEPVNMLHCIENDELVLASLKRFKTVMEAAPTSNGARNFRDLASAVINLDSINRPSGGIQFFLERLLRKKSENN